MEFISDMHKNIEQWFYFLKALSKIAMNDANFAMHLI